MSRSIWLLIVLIACVGLACSGGNPTAPATTATIEGTVNPSSSAASYRAFGSNGSGGGGQISVSVMGTDITATTDSSGRFVLSGVPAGSVTLRFQGPGIDATLTISGIVAGQTLTITVHVSGNHADLEPDQTSSPSPSPSSSPSPEPSPSPNGQCFAAGEKAEVEGDISAIGASDITVDQQGKGNFDCLVSPTTAIRHGNTTLTFSQLAVGNHVHVSGTGMGNVGGTCEVQASEIKVQ